jgi:hypothetical protein
VMRVHMCKLIVTLDRSHQSSPRSQTLGSLAYWQKRRIPFKASS